MANQLMEQPRSEVDIHGRAPIETAAKVMSSPDHPQYTADKAVAIKLAGGRSGLIAAIDGVGSGGQQSAEAAKIVQENLQKIGDFFTAVPILNQGTTLLTKAIFESTARIEKLQRPGQNTDVDTTVSAGIICESPDGKRRFLLTANVGDSRIYRYRPRTGEIDQLTRDHSLVESLLAAGIIQKEEAFAHPERNIVTRTVGSLKDRKNIDFAVHEIQEGDVYIAVSDGISDNIPPSGLSVAIRTEFRNAYRTDQEKIDLNSMATQLCSRARNIMTGTQSKHGKPDDASVAILRVQRATGGK